VSILHSFAGDDADFRAALGLQVMAMASKGSGLAPFVRRGLSREVLRMLDHAELGKYGITNEQSQKLTAILQEQHDRACEKLRAIVVKQQQKFIDKTSPLSEEIVHNLVSRVEKDDANTLYLYWLSYDKHRMVSTSQWVDMQEVFSVD